jgi:hypothetical protein
VIGGAHNKGAVGEAERAEETGVGRMRVIGLGQIVRVVGVVSCSLSVLGKLLDQSCGSLEDGSPTVGAGDYPHLPTGEAKVSFMEKGVG